MAVELAAILHDVEDYKYPPDPHSQYPSLDVSHAYFRTLASDG